jgi:hypothetical protein
MTSFSDIFNTSFLILLGILVLAISLLFIYYESKMREQNHKINSMLSLVSSLAEETNNLKNTLGIFMMNGGNNIGNFSSNLETRQPFQVNKSEKLMENNLITVSDDDDDESDNESDNESNNTDSDSMSDNESNSDESDDDDNNSESSDNVAIRDINEDNKNEINESINDLKVLKLNLNATSKNNENSDSDDEQLDIDADDLNDDDIVSMGDMSLNSDSEQIATDAILSLHNIVDNNNIIITLHSFNQEQLNNDTHEIEILDADEKKENDEIINLNKDDFKSININQGNLEDKTNDNLDYKKLPINKLRTIVAEKGLTSDSSKLKKNELLKLLGIE